MTLSGLLLTYLKMEQHIVLIPLLVDDPLWVWSNFYGTCRAIVLIPLLVDDPLWVAFAVNNGNAGFKS